ncbi:MAG: helix-turn-helix domain-containing protein, partial [Moorea sp. SIO3E2]|nr:helix-turn-helix domain-containing protein [Moorena sp. SIO3E2]
MIELETSLVDITLKGRSWLLIVADGKKKYEGMLEEGTQ